MTPERRPAIYGPEPCTTLAGTEFCHFDHWFALVALADFDGDLDSLEHNLGERLGSSRHSRHDIEAKLSHLADLRERLTDAAVETRLTPGR